MIKDPADELDYGFDWTAWLGEDTITASTWTVPDGITKDSDTFSNTSTTIWLSGGTDKGNYNLVNRITTAGGRIKERSLPINVRDQ